MKTEPCTRIMALIAAAILVSTARPTLAEPPEVRFVRGDPLAKNVSRGAREFAAVITVFETIPPYGSRRSVDRLRRSAVFKSARELRISEQLYNRLRNGDRYKVLIDHTSVEDSPDEPPRDRWMVLGVDDAMVKALSENLISGMSATWENRVAEARRELLKVRGILPRYEKDAREKRRRYDEAFRGASDRGVAALDLDAVKSASLELRNSLTVTLADEAELQSRLKTAIDHDRRQRVALVEAGEDVDKSPLIRKLAEMQSDLEIDLAGKLARREALEGELTRLAEGGRYLVSMQIWNPDEAESRLRSAVHEVERHEEALSELESTGRFRVVGSKIVISPIAEPATTDKPGS